MKRFRKHIRLPGYDYSTPGAYFVTICTHFMRPTLGEISKGAIHLSSFGTLVDECLCAIPVHYPTTELDVYQIMPNHLHAIIVLHERANILGNIVGSFKAAATRQIHLLPGHADERVWETSYYDHIIRPDDSISRVRRYILNNPLQWELDRYNPQHKPSSDKDDWFDILGNGA